MSTVMLRTHLIQITNIHAYLIEGGEVVNRKIVNICHIWMDGSKRDNLWRLYLGAVQSIS
jgi:hypothetical protein